MAVNRAAVSRVAAGKAVASRAAVNKEAADRGAADRGAANKADDKTGSFEQQSGGNNSRRFVIGTSPSVPILLDARVTTTSRRPALVLDRVIS